MQENEDSKILTDEDYIYNKKYGYSLNHFLNINKRKISNKLISSFLKISEEDIDQIYKRIEIKAKKFFGE